MPNYDLYDILDIPPSADLDAVKRAYRRQMRQHHPDQYAARREALRQKNDVRGLRDIDRTIADAHAMTQRLNEAYRILSDADARERYDRDRRLQAQRSASRPSASRPSASRPSASRPSASRPSASRPSASRPSASRPSASRPSASRPNFHRRTQAPMETVPWAILAGFIVVLLLGFSTLSVFLGVIQQGTSSTPTGFSALELQATTNARQATYVARTQMALAPTATPLSQSDLLVGASNFYRRGSFGLAIENYTEAILREPDNAELYYLRGRSHLGLAQSPHDDATADALNDFERALSLDATLYDVYRERGLVYYALWLLTDAVSDAEQARADLRLYVQVAPPDDDVREALAQLDG